MLFAEDVVVDLEDFLPLFMDDFVGVDFRFAMVGVGVVVSSKKGSQSKAEFEEPSCLFDEFIPTAFFAKKSGSKSSS